MTAHSLLLIGVFAALGLSAAMALASMLQRRTGNSGFIDVGWTLGTGLVGVLAALAPLEPAYAPRQYLVAVLAALWSLRLGLHILRRTRSIADDPRYAKLAAEWGAAAPRRMIWMAQGQALAGLPLALAIALAAHNPAPGLTLQDGLAVALLALSVLGEGVADRQLKRYTSDSANRGGICDRGLWAWSRHPNYFFEWLSWLAYPIFAIGPGNTFGWLALGAPVLMYLALVHGTGIPPLEQHMRESRGPAFEAYRRRVSAFFPMPPKRPEKTA